MATPKVTTRKWGGDDAYSWAVFVEGQTKPVVSGLGREEARSHKGTVEKLLRERQETGK